VGNSKFQAPNSKEAPKIQAPIFKVALPSFALLDFGAWNFFGFWNLEFGVSGRGSVIVFASQC
jgi:hypothetical protein